MSDELNEKIQFYGTWVALTALPALATLWMALAPVYGISGTTVTQVAATLTAVDAFIGTLLGVNQQKITEAYLAAAKNELAASLKTADTDAKADADKTADDSKAADSKAAK